MNKDNKVQTGPLTRELMLAVGNAIRRVNELRQQRIVTPGSQEEIASAQSFIGHVLSEHANELVGTWLACNSEYTPLVEGIAALLRRAHVQNERMAQQVMARVQAQQAQQPVGAGIIMPEEKPKDAEPTEQQNEQAAANIISGTFGEANKTGAPVE